MQSLNFKTVFIFYFTIWERVSMATEIKKKGKNQWAKVNVQKILHLLCKKQQQHCHCCAVTTATIREQAKITVYKNSYTSYSHQEGSSLRAQINEQRLTEKKIALHLHRKQLRSCSCAVTIAEPTKHPYVRAFVFYSHRERMPTSTERWNQQEKVIVHREKKKAVYAFTQQFLCSNPCSSCGANDSCYAFEISVHI